MIHLIGIGNDKGNITLNAFKAIKEADVIINYNDIDLSFFDSEIKDKEIISAIDLINDIDLEDDLDLNDDVAENIDSDEDLDSEINSDDLESNIISDDLESNIISDDLESNIISDDLESNVGSDDLESDIDSDDSSDIDLEDDLKSNPLLERILQENFLIELAISKSLESKQVALIVSDDPNILGLSNRFLQIKSKYSDVKYKIYPGVSSISQSASIVGAPLGDFALIDLSNPITSLSEIEDKVKHILDANLVLAIKNPIDDKREDGREAYNLIKSIINEYNDELLTAIVYSDGYYSIDEFKNIYDEDIDENSIFFIGNKLSYILEESMVTSSDYIVETKLISWSIEFFERYLNGEVPRGLDYDCDFLPCHVNLEACDFCYCPFYPCADGVTGGEWIKDRDVWSCQHCDWIHLEEPCVAIREGLDDILKEIDDLKDKHIELLKLRRKSLLKTLK
ncbi:cysteine-rich small domain-containing protein [Methanobrevibacter ruminantium]|nr:cysteine-rich small domain-containing protein [Methanobrevibacter ruminantium]